MGRERILIVEDNVTLEGLPLALTLEKAGFEVIGIAETEKDAVEIAAKECPSVVLMDIELLDGGGNHDRLAGLRAASKIQAFSGAEIIFVTGILTEPDVLLEAKKMRHLFLVKPVPEPQLLASIQLAVARTKRAKEYKSVFVCYSHADKLFAEEMLDHLKVLKKLGICPWIDTQINPSHRWEVEINRALAGAKAAICLVSIKFIGSDFITKMELPSLLRSEADRGLCVYPVFVNFVDETVLKTTGLLDFQGINRPDKPIAAWSKPKRQQDCWGVLCKSLQSEMAAHIS